MTSLFEQQEWMQAVANLKAKAAQFSVLFAQVEQTGDIVSNKPALAEQRSKLLLRGITIRTTIEALTRSIDFVVKQWNQFFGDEPAPDNLGVIPLVPVAVIASAIAAITYWINDTTKYINRVEEIKRLESQGYTPEQAYNIVEKKRQGILSAIFDPTFLWVSAGVIGVLVFTSIRRPQDGY